MYILRGHLYFPQNKIDSENPNLHINQMCNLCKTKYKDFLIKHDEAACPFQQNLFCSSCACYGHSLSQCPDPPPVFPKRALEIKPVIKQAPLLEMVNSAESFKAFLRSKSRMPMKAVKTINLLKLVRQYANEKGLELSLVPQ